MRSRIVNIEGFQEIVKSKGHVFHGRLDSMEDIDFLIQKVKTSNPLERTLMYLCTEDGLKDLEEAFNQVSSEDTTYGLFKEDDASLRDLIMDLSFSRGGIEVYVQLVSGLKSGLIINGEKTAENCVLIINDYV